MLIRSELHDLGGGGVRIGEPGGEQDAARACGFDVIVSEQATIESMLEKAAGA